MLKGEEGVAEYEFEGAEVYAAFTPLVLGENHYVAAARAPVDEVLAIVRAVEDMATAEVTSVTRLLITTILVLAGIGVVIGLLFSRSISNPLKSMAAVAVNLAAGNKALARVAAALGAGDLSVRMDDASADAGQTVVAAYAARGDEIGDLVRAVQDVQQENNNVKSALQKMIEALRDVIARTKKTCDEQKAGDMDAHNSLDGLQGEYAALASGVNEALDSIALPIQEGIGILNEYAAGELTNEMRELPGKQMMLTDGLRNVRTNLQALIADAELLVNAAVNGQLDVRADAAKHQGAYQEIIQGINTIDETLIGQMNVTMRYLDDIAHGRELDEYTDDARGDYAKTKASINVCVEVLNSLQRDALKMADAGAQGRLEESVDVSAYEGGWQKIAAGLNGMMEAVRVPLEEVAHVLQAAAEGTLTMDVTGEYHGAFDELKGNLNTTVSKLDDALQQVAEAVAQVNSGSEQISDAAQSLSQGATEQASSLEEITSSVTEVASQTKTNAENASQANNLADSVRKAAETGSAQMTQMVESMHSIDASSQQIAKIIKVIDDIAFQTNLLALNAAVEAARAGRHGKGFAVVADEVRNLAGRSAKAAKETAELIESSSGKVEAGMQVASATAESFKEIVDGIIKTNDLAGEIAAASNEQAQGVSQVNIGLSQVDQVTQQNTANAEETASAAQELSSQATHLQALVARFNLRNQHARALPEAKTKKPEEERPKANATASGGGWEDHASGQSDNKDIIDLDDTEFGKY
jgi:methyl-accepting chemotaxis protein